MNEGDQIGTLKRTTQPPKGFILPPGYNFEFFPQYVTKHTTSGEPGMLLLVFS